jgi:valyl-tRNA synthetase
MMGRGGDVARIGAELGRTIMSVGETLPKQYDPQKAQVEAAALWERLGVFHADATSRKPPYCIVIPPPNVTGALHLGHALNNTIQDVLIRWRRMQGFEALWMPGTDHAGIATQAVVEKRMFEEEKKTRHDVGREALVGRIWAWKDEYEARILSQLKAMGCSCDWERTRFTLDAVCARAVRETFFRLFQAGKIFRGKRLVNWDVQLRTAVADDEIYTEETAGHLWTIKYPVAGSDEVLHVATTRPETMLGDTAVAVHPEDERYRHLIGKQVQLPLTGRTIPVVGDAILVDPAFGTGCVKVTPAHDPNDYAAGQRNRLPIINLMNPDGTYNENAGEAYAGLDRVVVRKRVVKDLEEQGFLVRIDSHLVPLKHSDRSKTAIEPYLSDQWFVRMGDEADGTPGFAQQAIEAVSGGRLKIHPERYARAYTDWLAEKRDWCISRQLWWGHRIPIWHCATCTEADLERAFGGNPSVVYQPAEAGGWLVCGREDVAADALGPDHVLTQDPDVLDTWFSSALWPHSTLGWPEKTPELAKFYPTSVLSTARDIITLWVARMVIFGQFNMGDVPFKDVSIHPVILDGKGERMSKMKGNGLDPVDIIELYGADALRFGLASLATETQDIRMPVEKVKLPDGRTVNSSERFELARPFANKLWNAARLVMMNAEGYDPDRLGSAMPAENVADLWILGRLQRTAAEVTGALEGFGFAEMARGLRDFTWNDFCDWYLEFAKGPLRSEDPARKLVAQHVALTVVDGLCRLLHPVMPFVTEQVWQALGTVAPRRFDPATGTIAEAPESVSQAAWPSYPEGWFVPSAEAIVGQWREKITALRTLRAERNVPEKAKVRPVFVATGPVADALRMGLEHIRSLGNAESVEVVGECERPAGAATAVLGDAEIVLPLEGLIDTEAEAGRLRKQKADLEKQIGGLVARLGNEQFVTRANPEVVAAQRAKLEEMRGQLETVEGLLAALG